MQRMDYINAFWVGGLICALVQILMEKTKMMPGRIMVLLVVTGAVISALGWYEPFLYWEHLRYIRLFRILPEQEPVYRYWALEMY